PLTESRSPIVTRVRGRPSSYCMALESMGWASSAISSVFFRYWKDGKRCSGKCLEQRRRVPILRRRGGKAWSAPCSRPAPVSFCPTCVVSELLTNPERKAPTQIRRLARDVVALIDHLHLDAVDVIGFSMGSGVAAKLLALRPPQVKSAILAGV